MCQSLQLSAEEQVRRHCVSLNVRNGETWKGLPPLGAVVVQDWGTYQTCFMRKELCVGDKWHGDYPIVAWHLIGILGFIERGRRVMRSGSAVVAVVLDARGDRRSVIVTTAAPDKAPWDREPFLVQESLSEFSDSSQSR